jgi:DNA polymerase-3 subunit beta
MSRDAEVSAATVGTKLTLSCDGSRHILPTYPVRDFPRPAWTEPSKELDAAGLADRLSIRAGESTARFKLVEGKFPDVRRITPNPINHRLCAERVALHDAAQAVAGLGMGKFPFARMSVVGGVLKISTTGESEHEFAIPCDGELPDLGVAPAQLADALGALTGARVTCAVKDDMSAIVLIGDKSDRSCLVMPARI